MTRAWTLALGLAATAAVGASLAACGPADPIVCAPNATHDCTCPDGHHGGQTCNSDGTGFSRCSCTTMAQDGGGIPQAEGGVNPLPDVPSTPPPPPPPPSCSGASSCAACTPLNGCGWCNGRCVPGAPTGSSDGACSGTSWAWTSDQCAPPPPACARGSENTVAACSDGCDNDGNGYTDCNDFNCCNVVACGATTSCGRRAMCAACDSSGACPGGGTCLRRVCDGRAGCYASSSASCNTIAGVACPAVYVYDRCASSADCGPLATCRVPFLGSIARCWPTTTVPNTCPPPPPSATGVTASLDSTVCETGTNGGGSSCSYECRLRCTAGASCPYGMACVSGYCTN